MTVISEYSKQKSIYIDELACTQVHSEPFMEKAGQFRLINRQIQVYPISSDTDTALSPCCGVTGNTDIKSMLACCDTQCCLTEEGRCCVERVCRVNNPRRESISLDRPTCPVQGRGNICIKENTNVLFMNRTHQNGQMSWTLEGIRLDRKKQANRRQYCEKYRSPQSQNGDGEEDLWSVQRASISGGKCCAQALIPPKHPPQGWHSWFLVFSQMMRLTILDVQGSLQTQTS